MRKADWLFNVMLSKVIPIKRWTDGVWKSVCSTDANYDHVDVKDHATCSTSLKMAGMASIENGLGWAEQINCIPRKYDAEEPRLSLLWLIGSSCNLKTLQRLPLQQLIQNAAISKA